MRYSEYIYIIYGSLMINVRLGLNKLSLITNIVFLTISSARFVRSTIEICKYTAKDKRDFCYIAPASPKGYRLLINATGTEISAHRMFLEKGQCLKSVTTHYRWIKDIYQV